MPYTGTRRTTQSRISITWFVIHGSTPVAPAPFLHLLPKWGRQVYVGSANRATAQASSHRRHSSAQMRQCSWCCAWWSHSSADLRQASIHASRTILAWSGTNSVCLLRTPPVDRQMSLQFRQSVMHLSRVSTSGSPRSASAHAVQVWAQTKHSSMHAAKTLASSESARGCVSSICCARDMITPLVSALTSRAPPSPEHHRAFVPRCAAPRLTHRSPPPRIDASHSSKEVGMAWRLKGSYVETCSCDLICPCNATFDHGATYDYCRVTLVFNIREGDVEGIDIGGLKVAAIADTPKVMTDGNWRLGVFIDENASDEQADKLVKVFTGQIGGPMAALGPLVGEMLGVERAAITVEDDGVRHSVRVGDSIDFEIEDIVPFGVETGQPVRFQGMFHPVASDLTIAEAKRSRINAFGIEYEGKTGLSTSEFSWAA